VNQASLDPEAESASIFTAAIIVVSVIAVIATAGAAAPIVLLISPDKIMNAQLDR